MPIYIGSQKVKPLGIKYAFCGTNEVYYKRLPSAYQEVEYIQSSGTQYFNLNRTLNQTNKIEFDFQYLSVGSGSRGGIFGDYGGVGVAANPNAYDGYYPNRMMVWRGSNMATIDTNTTSATPFTNRSTLVIDMPNNSCSWQGFTKTLPSATGSTTGCWLLTIRDGDGVTFYTTPIGVKIYSLKIYTSGTLSNYYIPCYRKSDNVIGLYDIVNKIFYTNAGTGTFTKGSDV